jgi:hypothetical protein
MRAVSADLRQRGRYSESPIGDGSSRAWRHLAHDTGRIVLRFGDAVNERDGFKGGLVNRHGRACLGDARLSCFKVLKTWMPGISPGMTSFVLA